MANVALITGVGGQDGVYLAELLLQKGYEVHGLHRSVLTNRCGLSELNLEALMARSDGRLKLYQGNVEDLDTVGRLITLTAPTEVYHLASLSSVQQSFADPQRTTLTNTLGTLNVLESIRNSHPNPKTCRVFNAASSEMYGASPPPQDEDSPFFPTSPYAATKLFGYWTTRIFRDSHGLFACSGVLFNHESPLRRDTFVSRKISRAMARIKLGMQQTLYLGNLDAKRDWGHARDYVEAQWLMLQQPQPRDFVIAFGEQHSVKDFVDHAAIVLGMTLVWHGRGKDVIGVNPTSSRVIVAVDPDLYRPSESGASYCGDPTAARCMLGWTPRTSFQALVEEMIHADLQLAESELLSQQQ